MSVAAIIGLLFDGVPLLRRAWRWLLERQMEVALLAPMWRSGRDPDMTLQVAIEAPADDQIEMRASIFAHFAMRLVNHRPDRKERIVGAKLALKKHWIILWRRTLVEIPVHQRGQGQLLGPIISDIELEPISSPVEIQCVAQETLDQSLRERLPKRFEMWLVLDMVGPIRKLQRKILPFERRNP
ncbi:MAG: hypothetical protein WD379_05875 [Dehalococcoidia bacterium]